MYQTDMRLRRLRSIPVREKQDEHNGGNGHEIAVEHVRHDLQGGDACTGSGIEQLCAEGMMPCITEAKMSSREAVRRGRCRTPG